jgi:hypothetical protein
MRNQLPDLWKFVERLLIVGLLMAGAAIATYTLVKFEQYQQANTIAGIDPNEGALRIPPEVQVPLGEPVEIRADTTGKRVIWMALDEELNLRPLDNRACWLYGVKKGEYRLIAWTAVNNLPTQNAVCIVKVGAADPKTAKANTVSKAPGAPALIAPAATVLARREGE